jgi:type II secretion system protein N
MQIDLSPRMRRASRYAGIVLIGLITFVFALQLSLPIERARDKFIETMSPSYDVTIGGAERGIIPGRFYFTAVQLRSRPSKPDEPVSMFYIEKLKVDVGLFAALRGNLSVDFAAQIGAGELAGNVTLPGFGKKGVALHIKGRDLPGTDLPLRGLIGLPMTGKLELDADLDLQNENRGGKQAINWQKAEGSFEFSCPNGCTFGDGKTKLKPLLKNRSNQVMVGEGIDFGKVEIDTLVAKAEFKDGSFTVTKFDTSSHDGELHVDYTMKLEPDIMESMVTGCLRFKGSDSLLKREPKTFAAIQTTGAELRGDGLFHITLADKLRDMKRLNQECGPNLQHAQEAPHAVVRPNITVMPDEPKAAPVAPAPPPPPVAAPPAPPVQGSAGSAEPAPIGAPNEGMITPGAAAQPQGSAGGAAHAGEPPPGR